MAVMAPCPGGACYIAGASAATPKVPTTCTKLLRCLLHSCTRRRYRLLADACMYCCCTAVLQQAAQHVVLCGENALLLLLCCCVTYWLDAAVLLFAVPRTCIIFSPTQCPTGTLSCPRLFGAALHPTRSLKQAEKYILHRRANLKHWYDSGSGHPSALAPACFSIPVNSSY